MEFDVSNCCKIKELDDLQESKSKTI